MWSERWITQLGETANMSGTTINYAYWPAPAGGTAVITGNSTTTQYFHKDWIGNARIVSNNSHVVSSDQAYTPYGEMYAVQTGASTYFDWFAGMSGNFNNGVLFDTPNREFAQSDQGRFLSPDPAGSGWNQYAYPANPNSESDPSGLDPYFRPRLMAWEWNGWKNVLTEYGGGGYGAMAEASVAADAFDEAAARTIAQANRTKARSNNVPPPPDVSNLPITTRQSQLPNSSQSQEPVQGCTGPGIPCVAVLQQLQPPPVIQYAADGSIVSAYRPYNYMVEDNEGTPLLSVQSTEWLQHISNGSATYVEGTTTNSNPLTDNVGWVNAPLYDGFVSAQIVTVKINGGGPSYLLDMTILHGAAIGDGIFSPFANVVYWTQYPKP